MKPALEVGRTVRPPLFDRFLDDIARMPMAVHFRGEPGLPKWEGRCKVHFDPMGNLVRHPHCPLAREEALRELRRSYNGPNKRLGDYYVREVERTGTERRQVVHFEVVGTGRIEKMPRSRFDRQVRPA